MSLASYEKTVVVATAVPLPPPPAKKIGIRTREDAAQEAAEAARYASLPAYFEHIGEHIPDGVDVEYLSCIAPYADVQQVANHLKPFRRRCRCCANDLTINAAAAHTSDCETIHGWGGARLMVTMSAKEYRTLTARINRVGKKAGVKFEYYRVVDLFGSNWVFLEPECPIGVELHDPFEILDEIYLRCVKPWGCITSSRRRTGVGAAERKRAEDHFTEWRAEADKAREAVAEAKRVASVAYIEEREARLATTPPGCASNNPADMYQPTPAEMAAAEAGQQRDADADQERKKRDAAARAFAAEDKEFAAEDAAAELDTLPMDTQRVFRLLEMGVRPKRRRLPMNWKGCEEIGDALGGDWVHRGWYRVPPRNMDEFERRVAGGVAVTRGVEA